jgi:hypothetical protein
MLKIVLIGTAWWQENPVSVFEAFREFTSGMMVA